MKGYKYRQVGYGRMDPSLRKLYRDNNHIIHRGHRRGKLSEEFNYEIDNDITYDTFDEHLDDIYKKQTKSFKLNMSVGYVLRHTETKELRFYYPQKNDTIMSTPSVISNRVHLKRIKERLRSIDILQRLFFQRPNTKWTLYQLSVVRYTVFHINEYPLGNGSVPQFVKGKRCIIAFDKNSKGQRYYDNLCIFRCLAVYKGYSRKRVDVPARQYYRKYIRHNPLKTNIFPGIKLSEITKFEDLFQLNVDIFEMQENHSVRIVYRSVGKYDNTMYLNKYQNHLSLITNMSQYTNKYTCNHCSKLFRYANKLKIHEKNCKNKIKLFFPGKYFTLKPSIFEELEDFGISVKKELRYFSTFAVFDFEACLVDVCEGQRTDKLEWTKEHKAISVSICSNVKGFTHPKCFVESDEDTLLEKMISYLNEISNNNAKTLHKKFAKVFKRIYEIKDHLKETSHDVDSSHTDDVNECFDEMNGHLSDVESMCMETDYCEEPSAEFLEVISKPNTYRQFLGMLQI